MPANPRRQGASDDDVQFLGFQRVDVSKSTLHRVKLEEDGLVFTGFQNSRDYPRRPPPVMQRARSPAVIDLVSSDNEGEPGRAPSAPALSLSSASPTLVSSKPQSASSTQRSNSARMSETTAVDAPRGAPPRPRVGFRPSSPSALAKRVVPGEFTLPGRAKRRKKEEQRQAKQSPQSSAPPSSSKRSRPDRRSASTSKGPPDTDVIVISSDDEPEPKRPRRRLRIPIQPDAVEPERARSHSYSGQETWQNQDVPDSVPVPSSPAAGLRESDADGRSDNSEDEYSMAHDALVLNRRANWKPTPYSDRSRIRDEDLSARLSEMTISSQPPANGSRRLRGRINPPERNIMPVYEDYYGKPYVWTRSCGYRKRRTDNFTTLRGLCPVVGLAHAPGAINRIVQSNGIIAIASAAAGGDEDPAELSAVDPYNREGALSVWYEGRHRTLHAHERMLDDVDPQAVEHFSLAPVTKHYAVQDVQFNPAYPTRIASSANDLTVRIWDCDQVFNEDEESPEDEANPEDKQSPEPVHTEEYECTMGKLLFKPGEPVLAMGGHDGSVYVLRDEGRTPIASRLRLARGKTDETGDIAWGCGPLSDKLFASSMTKAEKAFSGTHKVFDMTTERPICTMEIQEAGDSIAVHPAGTFVAIATKPSKRAHTLYLFDGRRLGSQPVHTLALDSFQQSVTTMKFSPDGVYLALARDDNTTDVYDARFLGRRKLHAFTHEPGNVLTYTKDVYGVVEAQWVEGHPSGLGLVTGGCDGCVRLWDVRLADSDPNNGLPIAQCGHDLGHFSLGDPSRDEMPLVIGEMSGKVTIFDHTGRHR